MAILSLLQYIEIHLEFILNYITLTNYYRQYLTIDSNMLS